MFITNPQVLFIEECIWNRVVSIELITQIKFRLFGLVITSLRIVQDVPGSNPVSFVGFFFVRNLFHKKRPKP